MDALGFTLPLELASASTKLIGSVSVKELDPCSSLLREKAASHTINASETTTWNKVANNTELPKHNNLQLVKQGGSSVVHHNHFKNGLLLTPKAEGVNVEHKTGKFSRTSGPCPKRPRVVQLLQDPSRVGIDGINDMSRKLVSCTLKCTSSEKPQLAKQKNNISKRGDKRSPRFPVKTKHDSFSVKAGLSGFGSAAGGNNFLGVYGLKSDHHDATKLIDDLPLNELLCANYKPLSTGKEKGKKPAIGNESFLNLIRQSCSILQHQKPIQSQNIVETDSFSNKKMSPWLLSAVSIEASGVNGDAADSSTIDMSSSNKEASVKSKTALHQPLDILQRLTLPPPKDLESLLMDATKPPLSSKIIPDTRTGKQVVARRVSLPPFPWSHTSNGHSRANSDVVKLSTIKGTCPGRWLRIGKNVMRSLGNVSSGFMDLESLTYDQRLVPSELKVTYLDNEISSNTSTSLVGLEWDSLPSTSCSKVSDVALVPGGKATDPGNAVNCPKVIAAAQTLYEIATHLPKQSLDRHIRWPKKSSQKAMKARKSKSNEKTNEPHPTPILPPPPPPPPVSLFRSENSFGRSEDMIPLTKKPKLSQTNHKKDINYLRKESVSWSNPRSSRSSPGKSIKESVTDARYPTANIVKQSYMMPPPPPIRVPENIVPNVQQKLRKLMPFEWNRGRDR